MPPKSPHGPPPSPCPAKTPPTPPPSRPRSSLSLSTMVPEPLCARTLSRGCFRRCAVGGRATMPPASHKSITHVQWCCPSRDISAKGRGWRRTAPLTSGPGQHVHHCPLPPPPSPRGGTPPPSNIAPLVVAIGGGPTPLRAQSRRSHSLCQAPLKIEYVVDSHQIVAQE
jgi:hypothetical protein